MSLRENFRTVPVLESFTLVSTTYQYLIQQANSSRYCEGDSRVANDGFIFTRVSSAKRCFPASGLIPALETEGFVVGRHVATTNERQRYCGRVRQLLMQIPQTVAQTFHVRHSRML